MQVDTRTTKPVTHAVVACQPGREATRALRDALPLLRNAATVDVGMIDPVIGESRHREQPGADIATHLTRHGLRVNIVVHAREGETAAMALMRHAVESGAPCRCSGAASSHATTNTSMRCAMPGMRFPKHACQHHCGHMSMAKSCVTGHMRCSRCRHSVSDDDPWLRQGKR